MDKEIQEFETWNSLRPILNNSYNYNENWAKAIKLFQTRLKRKFFSPLQSIIDKRLLEGEGFTIVTVQCALIESLASFRNGQIFVHKRVNGQASFIYNQSRKMFVEFLHTSSIFKDNFYQVDDVGAKTPDSPFNADDFYTKVRCGLMHEARTKNEWYINATKKDVTNEKVFIERQGARIKLLRTILHYRLKECVAIYLKDLKQKNVDGETLRRLFARKLDHLFDILPNAEDYEWWIDR